MAIIIPLTEVTSGKEYKMIIPKFKNLGTTSGNTIPNNQVEFMDDLSPMATNTALQFDVYDNECAEVIDDTYTYKTKSGKELYVRYSSGTSPQVNLTYGVVLNGIKVSAFSISSGNNHGSYQGIRIDKLTYAATAGIGLAYCENNKKFYKMVGNTACKNLGNTTAPDGSQQNTFQLYSDSQVSPPFKNPIKQNEKLCFYNADSAQVATLIQVNTFETWFNDLPTTDYSNSSYPDQNPDGDDNNGQSKPDKPSTGDGDTSSDPIPDPPTKPLYDVTNTGFVVLYNPSAMQIRELAYFMWSGEFVDLIKKMFVSPFEAIISLKMLFCPVTTGAAQTVWLGNVETGVSMPKVTDQFTDIDLGTLNVNEFFGSFADYAPFTKIQIYLPFVGYKDLNVDEVMNSQLHLRYRVDVYTGACIAYITVTKSIKSTQLNSILYQFDGNCAMEIPFTSNDNSRYVSAIMNAVASSAMSLANTSGFTVTQPPVGNFTDKADKSFHLGTLRPVAQGMLDIISSKPNVQRAGALSGAVSAMAVKQPYIIIHRPIAQMPADYQHYLGIPLNLTMQLSEVTGFTIVSQIFFASQTATDEEIVMITELLKGGIIL